MRNIFSSLLSNLFKLGRVLNILVVAFLLFQRFGIAIAYGLDGPGIESRWRRDFSHLSRPALRPTQPPVQWVPGLSRGKGAAGA